MKVYSSLFFLVLLCTVKAFSPSTDRIQRTSFKVFAEPLSRNAFFDSTAAAILAGFPSLANAATMGQETILDPTEKWETGSPTPEAAKKRSDRFKNARTQLNSNFAPQKRLTLERKSPVTRLDLNAPDFETYKKTFPGLFKKVPES